jgi:hypothetical protein
MITDHDDPPIDIVCVHPYFFRLDQRSHKRSAHLVNINAITVITKPIPRRDQQPRPQAIPRTAHIQTVAAVVRPLTWPSGSLKITPAPKKPIPVRIPCSTRPVAFGSIGAKPFGKICGTRAAAAAQRVTKTCTPKPAGLLGRSRSIPMALPRISAAPNRMPISAVWLNTISQVDHDPYSNASLGAFLVRLQ